MSGSGGRAWADDDLHGGDARPETVAPFSPPREGVMSRVDPGLTCHTALREGSTFSSVAGADTPPFAKGEGLIAIGAELAAAQQVWSMVDLHDPHPQSVTHRQKGAAPPVENDRPTLLVVDDERDVLRSVHDLLRLDYRVITCQRGAEALEILRSARQIHVILSDQKMPEMTGVEILRQAKVIRPETIRLLFTAYADIRTVIDAVNQGHIFRYLSKPWVPEELEAVVRQAVEHHNLIVEKNRLVAELQESNARLLEANRLKGAFIEVASHELNTPVTVVLGTLELWKMSQGENASLQERQWFDRIGASARRLARTVERMLKLVRNRDFTHSLEWETVEVQPLLRRAADELVPYLELRRQNLTLEVEPNLGPVRADSSKLSDVVINLLANAIKFTPDGGTIRIEAREEPGQGDWIRVQVSDEGVGVSPDDRPHLFEPFFTGFDTLRHSSGDYQFGKRGIGLGLWLVKTFVELHGGRVEVASNAGVGSTFAFLLPRFQTGAADSMAGLEILPG
jgi:signal transduction histidine kinase